MTSPTTPLPERTPWVLVIREEPLISILRIRIQNSSLRAQSSSRCSDCQAHQERQSKLDLVSHRNLDILSV